VIVEKSPASTEYNCIAWAARETGRWWWPDAMNQYYWPPGVPRVESVDAFVAAYASLGYELCASAELEDGFERVIVYVDGANRPTHAARLLSTGWWTSKLGSQEDVEHDKPEDVSALGPNPLYHYGAVGAILRRKLR
jgi:hypothetical protein